MTRKLIYDVSNTAQSLLMTPIPLPSLLAARSR